MVPATIRRPLARLRRTERSLRFVWGTARTAALFAVLLMLCCLADWLVDLWQDTPRLLLWGMHWLQVFVLALAFVFLIVRPLWLWLSDSQVALWIEEICPALRHRLITAVQLNQPGANTKGMSPELIGIVTREAEKQVATVDVGKALNYRRLLWSLVLVLPLALLAGGLYVAYPETVQALLARQLLYDNEIPRSVQVETADTPAIWPAGEPITITVRANGPGASDQLTGRVRLRAEGQPVEDYALTYKGAEDVGWVLYSADVPASAATSYRFQAWLGDGRTRRNAEVSFEPRPAVADQDGLRAVVYQPAYCGLRPTPLSQLATTVTGLLAPGSGPNALLAAAVLNPQSTLGTRYLQTFDKGDVTGYPGAMVRVEVKFNKPVEQATLSLLGSGRSGGTEGDLRILKMTLSPGGTRGEAIFDLRPEETAYQIVLHDFRGWDNLNLPRRTLSVLPVEPPEVVLLPEQFPGLGDRSALEDAEVDGIPVPLGKPFRVAYRCRTGTCLKDARFRYRIIKHGSDVSSDDNIPWQLLPLTEWRASEEVGVFDLNQGVFEKTGFLDEIEFHAVPSLDPDKHPGRINGGGRFDFKTKQLPELSIGDKVEYYIEVFNVLEGQPPGKSMIRTKDIVGDNDLTAWLKAKKEETRKLRDLEAKQSGIFNVTAPDLPPK